MLPPAKAFLPASEAMLTIWPVLRRIIEGATARVSRNTALRLVSNTEVQSDSEASWMGVNTPTPALFTRISMGPSASSARAMREEASSECVRSAAREQILTSGCCSSLATASNRLAVRAERPKLAPRLARRRAMASPMPRLAPVTSATFPARGFWLCTAYLQEATFWADSPSYNQSTVVAKEQKRSRYSTRSNAFSLARAEGFTYNPVEFVCSGGLDT